MAVRDIPRPSTQAAHLRQLYRNLENNLIPDERTIVAATYGEYTDVAYQLYKSALKGHDERKRYVANLTNTGRSDVITILSGIPLKKPVDNETDEVKYQLHPLSFFKNLPKREWSVEKIIFDRGTSVFFGNGGSGKSVFVLDMMLSRAFGRDFLGRATKKGFIVWVAAESVDEIWPRVYAWMLHHNIPEEDAPDIWFLDERVPFNNMAEVDSFIESVQQQTNEMHKEISGIVFDTYARCTPGADENNTQETKLIVEAIAKIAQTFNTHVSVIHHTNAQGKIRGNTALRNDLDTAWEVTKEASGIKLRCDKMRGQLEPPDFYVKMKSQLLSEDDPEDTAPVIITADARDSEPFTPKAQRQMLEILQAHGRLSCNQWQKHCAEVHEIASRTFYNHRKTLESDGLVVVPEKSKGKAAFYSLSDTGMKLLNGGDEDEE